MGATGTSSGPWQAQPLGRANRGPPVIRTIATLAVSTALLGACGEARLDRGLSGAAIGAGLGAAASAATGGKLERGVVVGAALGATIGVLTDPRLIDLGKPVWRQQGA